MDVVEQKHTIDLSFIVSITDNELVSETCNHAQKGLIADSRAPHLRLERPRRLHRTLLGKVRREVVDGRLKLLKG